MADPSRKRRIHKAPMKTFQEQFVSEIACLPSTLLDPFSHPQGLLHVWRAPSWEEIAGGGEGQNRAQAAMNISRETKKTREQSQSAGARRSRRFTARTVLDVRESQACWTLKRPEGRAPFASRSDEPTVSVGFIPRLGAPGAPRRGATPESGAVFSIVAPRRRISCRIESWLESHGYHHQVAPRLRNRPG
jgi:hypothetical protein